MNWREITLGDEIEIKHGFAFKSQYFADSGRYVLLTPGNCFERGGLRLKGNKEKYYIGAIPDEFVLSTGDLIVVMTDLVSTSPILGGAFLIPEDDKFLHNQRLGLVRFKSDNLDKRFLYFLLNTQSYRAQVRGSASGTTVRHTAPKRIYRCKVRIPAKATQTRIASILSAYDDLIENNRRRIALLERAARELYREWFVRLRFPGHEHTKIVDGVPEGWERKTYSDLFKFLGGVAFRSKSYLSEGRFGIVTIKNVHDARFVPECPSKLDDVPEKMKEHCVLATGDILLSLTGNVGRACIVFGENYLLNQRVAKVVGNGNIPKSFTYWTFSNETTQKELENLAYGVAQLNLSPVKLGKRKLLKPPSALVVLFGAIADPIFRQITTLNLETAQLIQARDLLLPRLMSGEVAV